ncbi:MAG: YegS/Rv2252/BmrU family lipid kinase, partial [Evtepia sp.]
MERLLFIYNPRAGRDKIRPALSDIINKLTENGFLVTTYPTQAPKDAGDAITKWGAAFDRIVVAGGDGTLNEAVNGLLRLSDRPTIGYLPVGTTNDFSRNLDLPTGLLNLAEVATNGIPRPCDVGRLNGRLFLYVAAFGAFTEVSYDTPQASKNLLGYTAYLFESVKYWGSLKPYHVRIQYDHEQTLEGDYLYVMVSNSTS